MESTVYFGNAATDALGQRGWFVGHFVAAADDPRATGDVEVKWGLHPTGDTRPGWATNAATTLSILIRGRFRLRFPAAEFVLEREGDYCLWAPGVPHHWVAEAASVVLTVRWPSRPPEVDSGGRE